MLRLLLIGIIRVYQVAISPLKPPACRFFPSCSQYAVDAIGKWGIWKGACKAVLRLVKCHPWHPGGFDPV